MRIAALWMLVVVAAASCKGENKYDRMAREANAARADGGLKVAPYPPQATLLAGSQNGPRQVFVDADAVFWLNDGSRGDTDPGLIKVPKNGGPTVTLVKSDAISAVVADAQALYFLFPRAGKIMKQSKSGGEPTALADSQGVLRTLTLDDTTVYWAEDDGVFAVPKAGGKSRQVLSGIGLADFLVADQASLYWYSSVSGKASRGSKKGGAPAPLYADEQHTLNSFFLDGQELCISFGSSGKMELYHLPKTGGKPTLIVGGQEPASDIASDGSAIYWATEDAIFKVPRSGGSVEPVVLKGDRIRNLALDDSSVYWTDRGGRVQKMKK